MLLASNSTIYLILKKRKKKVKVIKNFTFDILIAFKRGHDSFFVIEKLGSLDYSRRTVTINIFRLVFWLSKNIAVTPKAAWFMFNFIIFKNK